jgi:hypothetical protein
MPSTYLEYPKPLCPLAPNLIRALVGFALRFRPQVLLVPLIGYVLAAIPASIIVHFVRIFARVSFPLTGYVLGAWWGHFPISTPITL